MSGHALNSNEGKKDSLEMASPEYITITVVSVVQREVQGMKSDTILQFPTDLRVELF